MSEAPETFARLFDQLEEKLEGIATATRCVDEGLRGGKSAVQALVVIPPDPQSVVILSRAQRLQQMNSRASLILDTLNAVAREV